MGSESLPDSQIPGNADAAGPGSTLELLLCLLRAVKSGVIS